jgi:hypothetical protein
MPKPILPPPLPPQNPLKGTPLQSPRVPHQSNDNMNNYPFQPLSSPQANTLKNRSLPVEIVPAPKSKPAPAPTAIEYQKLKDFVWDSKFKKFGEYILSPISGTFRVFVYYSFMMFYSYILVFLIFQNRYDMAKEFNFFSPKTTTEAIISEVRIRIDASQYLSVQKFLQWSRDYKLRLEVIDALIICN